MLLSALVALALASQTRYKVVFQNGVSWLVGPDKKPFFSLGVCCVDTGASFMEDDSKNRGYAAYRYYPSGKDAWGQDTVDRLQSWQFNTIGAWSDAKTLRHAHAPAIHFTPILHMGSGAGAPWRDMWDPKIVDLMTSIARDQIKEFRGDSRVIGYFSDNEQGWWYGALFDWAWKGPYTRAKLIAQLERRYGDWRHLLADFEPVQASSFASLRKVGRLYLRPGGKGYAAVDAYIQLLAERYYSLCASIIKKCDPGALYLGDRYISNFYPAVVSAAGRYADVVSSNLNADWTDGSFSPFYLSSLHRLTQKPLMITEYYMCATQNRTGNKNDSSGFPVVKTQAERASGFKLSTNVFLSDPNIVGTHWFQYYDEPANGRGDGENYNMGLVDVNNQPYEELTQAAASLDLQHRIPSTSMHLAHAPRLLAEQVSDLNRWPRDSAYLPPVKPSDRGDAFLGWTGDALYLAVYWNEDRFPEALYHTGRVPIVDEPELTLADIGKVGPVVIRLVEHGPAIPKGIEIRTLKLGVRNTVILGIPASTFGLHRLNAKATVRFKATLQTRSRAHTIQWLSKPLGG